MNIIAISGRLAADPDIRYTNTQMAVAKFTVAVDRFSKGEKKADFLPCVAFGKSAEFVEKYFHKGSGIEVSGSLQTDTYENKDGAKVKTYEIVANNVGFNGESSGKSSGTRQPRKNASASDEPVDGFTPITDIDVPF